MIEVVQTVWVLMVQEMTEGCLSDGWSTEILIVHLKLTLSALEPQTRVKS